MSTETDPPIIQADVPFNVEAVRGKSGMIDALAKRPRSFPSDQEDTSDAPHGRVGSSRRITDTRAKIAPDDPSLAEADLRPTTPEPTPEPMAEPASAAVPAPLAGSSASATQLGNPDVPMPAPEPMPLSDLERRMLDIKSSNEHLTRELEALEESLRQPPAAV